MARLHCALLLALAATGCVGTIRDTNQPRTSTEILLVSTAAERAVTRYDAAPLTGKKVFVDDSMFDSVDKNYVMAALQDHLSGAGAVLAAKPDAEMVLEIRNGALGIWDGDFNLGIPAFPFSFQGFPPILTPTLALFRRLSQQGYAKLQLWLYDPKTTALLSQSPDLWGHAYYNQWWWFGVGPFDGTNDVYPDIDLGNYMPGSTEQGD